MDCEYDTKDIQKQIEVDLQLDTFLDEEVENIILSSNGYLTQKEIDQIMRENEIKRGIIRPTKEKRLSFKSKQLKSRFEAVKQNVPGRQKEAMQIFQFISQSEYGSSTPLCLHGNTGCGKTSLIKKVIDFFQGNSSTLSSTYLNCMNMFHHNQVYAAILKQLFGLKEKRSERALNELFKHNHPDYKDKKKLDNTKIIVLDEIDHFISDQSFLYNLSEWIQMPHAKIILILISNVIDLTVKLDTKIQSRMKFQTIIFDPYSATQIQMILRYKYPQIQQMLTSDAITYTSKRIANINSDIRLLQKIINQVLSEFSNEIRQGKKIDMADINTVLYGGETKIPQLLKIYEPLIKIFHKAQKKSDVTYEMMNRLFLKSKRMPTSQQILLLLCQMQDYGLIELSYSKKFSDVTYQNYGIKINEVLHMMVPQEDDMFH